MLGRVQCRECIARVVRVIPLNGASKRPHILMLFHLKTEIDKRKHQRERQKQAAMCVGTEM